MTDALVHRCYGATQYWSTGQDSTVGLNINVLMAKFILARAESQSWHGVRYQDKTYVPRRK